VRKIKQFDAADYLDNETVIAEYLNAALEDENPDVFLAAISDVAKARGMSRLAKDAGLGRESLYKALSPGAKPRYDTVIKLLKSLGVELRTSPTNVQSRPARTLP
jgi:probable addiction module antidote protein